MAGRSYRDIGYFDRAIAQRQSIKGHFNRLLRPAGAGPPPATTTQEGEDSCLR